MRWRWSPLGSSKHPAYSLAGKPPPVQRLCWNCCQDLRRPHIAKSESEVAMCEEALSSKQVDGASGVRLRLSSLPMHRLIFVLSVFQMDHWEKPQR
ncbi:hypothetical protein C0J52_28285 [Blattella germanica]|nr:hypothetical protein C0J52_28285 [Blattella germanica]